MHGSAIKAIKQKYIVGIISTYNHTYQGLLFSSVCDTTLFVNIVVYKLVLKQLYSKASVEV